MTTLKDMSKDELIQTVYQLREIAMATNPEEVVMNLSAETMEAMSETKTLTITVEVSAINPIEIPSTFWASSRLSDDICEWFSNEEPKGYVGITKVRVAKMTYGDQEVLNA